jgi:hypothetical protein
VPYRPVVVLTLAATFAALLVACGGVGSKASAATEVQDTVAKSLDAENNGDVKTFLSLWTDNGLRSYDAGSRADLEAGRATLGAEKTNVQAFLNTAVKGSKATVTLDARVEIGLYRMQFDLVRTGGRWKMDGFRFQGSAPPATGTPVVDIKAVEYSYDVDRSQLASGNFALRFTDAGNEQHEISILSLPPLASTADAVLALAGVDGTDFSKLPAGYGALGHLAYAQPGDTAVYRLAGKLPAGHYAFVCFLPVGGVNAAGAPNVSGAPTHVSRGMLADFTVG